MMSLEELGTQFSDKSDWSRVNGKARDLQQGLAFSFISLSSFFPSLIPTIHENE